MRDLTPTWIITLVDSDNVPQHQENESYDSYIQRVSQNTIARTVKMADLRHNSDIMRMKGLREKDFQRLEKYHKAYAYLKECK